MVTTPIRALGQIPGHSRTIVGLGLSSLPMRTACLLEHNKVKIMQQGISTKSMEENSLFRNPRLSSAVQPRSNSNFGSSGASLPETIEQVYTCINDKNLKQLAELISDDCCFNDLSFSQPFKGRKEVMHFFEDLTAFMGKNVKFRIGHVCEGDGLMAAIDWHLEWQGKQIPFTRGCSFYEFAEDGKRLIIKEAKIVIESPIKPGTLALALLKLVTKLFDDFPKTTERFLKSPNAVFQTLIKIYNLFLWPFISPLLAWYINMWKFLARLFGFAIKIVLYVLRIFLR